MTKPHIFVAEDDQDVRSSIAEFLRDEGYDVAEFANLDHVLRELQAGARPCVVLMDFLMPGMTGPEFIAEIRGDDALASIPIIMITGARTHDADVEILHKPFDLSDLVAAVGRHCAHVSPDDRPLERGASPKSFP